MMENGIVVLFNTHTHTHTLDLSFDLPNDMNRRYNLRGVILYTNMVIILGLNRF
ncbi:hypothetical protein HanIR_Chr16g0829811 [Helianthus annuus]|nr:hypothetical protein HanIR_Chr16g0829811 [Helianthus annuus]